MDDLRAAIQAVLDSYGDGWSLNQFVVAIGIERITSEGKLESIPWWLAPDDQPDWQTDKLLEQALDDRATQDIE